MSKFDFNDKVQIITMVLQIIIFTGQLIILRQLPLL